MLRDCVISWVDLSSIATDKGYFFQPKRIEIFLIFLWKRILWCYEYPQVCFYSDISIWDQLFKTNDVVS